MKKILKSLIVALCITAILSVIKDAALAVFLSGLLMVCQPDFKNFKL